MNAVLPEAVKNIPVGSKFQAINKFFKISSSEADGKTFYIINWVFIYNNKIIFHKFITKCRLSLRLLARSFISAK